MALDEAIVKEVSSSISPPTLRFYLWDQPSLSIGYFQNPAVDLNLRLLNEKGIPWVRRMTGGRGIYHHKELTYSFSIPLAFPTTFLPADLKGSYRKIGLGFARGFQKLGVPIQLFTEPSESKGSFTKTGPNKSPLCFSRPSWYETLIDGKKVLGSAQKRYKTGFIQQGTLLLRHPFEEFNHFFNLTLEEKSEFIGLFEYLEKEISIADLEKCFISGIEEELGITFVEGVPTLNEMRIAEELSKNKYGSDFWNRNRIVL